MLTAAAESSKDGGNCLFNKTTGIIAVLELQSWCKSTWMIIIATSEFLQKYLGHKE